MPAKRPAPRPVVRRTNEDIYKLVEGQVLPRLQSVEKLAGESHGILKAAGLLNGKGDDLLEVLSEYRQERALRDARELVAASSAQRRRWLAEPKRLLWALLLGVASGIGYVLVVHP